MKNKEKINCPVCHREVLKTNISRHKKTKTCLKDGQAIALVVEQELKEREERERCYMGLEDKY